MIEVKPSFHMFSEEEVLENLVINQVNIQNETHICKFTQNIIFSIQARICVKTGDLDSLAKVSGRF